MKCARPTRAKDIEDAEKPKKMRRRILISVATFIIVAIIYHNLLWFDLKKNGFFVSGKIVSMRTAAKSSPNFYYEFFYEGKKQTGYATIGVVDYTKFYDKSFPVVISKLTKNSKMLITPRDFEKFKIEYPDSLRWVLDYLK